MFHWYDSLAVSAPGSLNCGISLDYRYPRSVRPNWVLTQSWLIYTLLLTPNTQYQYIYGCVFFSGVQILVRVGSSSSANHTHESYPEPYPESYLRIIPPKITIMNVSFGIVWDCMASLVLMDVTSQLTSVGQIRWSLAAFTYLHDMSGEAGWLARWLAAWLARLGGYGNCCCWLGGWL